MKKIVLKPLGFRKSSHSSEMRNDALMHPEGLKGLISNHVYSRFQPVIYLKQEKSN